MERDGRRTNDGIDRITLSVIGGYLTAAAQEMHLILIKAAYSLNVKERSDCSSSILDADGRTAALAAEIPLHLGSMLGIVEHIRSELGEDVRPGDVFIANDPYNGGGTHLPDITLAAPFFSGGRLLGFCANIAHHADVGGSSAGSTAIDHSDIFQEGLRLPVMRLVDQGRMRSDIVRLVQLNSRIPEDRGGDLAAQLAALRVGIARMEALVTRYGAEALVAAMGDSMDYAERRLRALLTTLPRTSVEAVDHLDPDEIVPTPVAIRVRVDSRGDSLNFDFTDTDAQVPSARNVPRNALLATVYAVVKQMLDPSIPANAGYYRAISVHTKRGSIVDPADPAAVANRAVTCNIIGDTLANALSQLVPSNAMAASGAYLNSIISGMDDRASRFFVNYEAFAGSMGAASDRDGLDAVRVYASGGANQSVEAMEMAYPVEVVEYGFVPDTGGAGRYRGGLATRRDIRVFGHGLRFTGAGARIRIAPRGFAAGSAGSLARFVLNPNNAEESNLGAVVSRRAISSGDVVRLETAGGGGYGDPHSRDRDLVARDLREGRITVTAARELYGFTSADVEDAVPQSTEGSGDGR